MSVIHLQIIFIIGGALVLPFAPFLWWQGVRLRRRVGRLPDAAGEREGTAGGGNETLNLLVIGESTVAGVGAANHAEALTGQIAEFLSLKTGCRVRWHALGESGITARETLERLVPAIPQREMDFVVVALGGNDTFQLNAPARWQQDLKRLLEIVREKNPGATVLVANVPVIRDFIAMPHPLKFVLWRLSRLHHRAARGLIRPMENVYYFEDIKKVDDDFFSDGIHPSAIGYRLWAEGMVNFLFEARK